MATKDTEKPGGGSDPANSMMLMMGLMMGLCLGTVLLFSLIPVIGWPLGIVLALGGFGTMLYLHQRLMGHSWHK